MVANPRMTAEIGRVLGGRYRLVAPIGMGASAQVYLADDVKLRRRVAVKMLHDALAGDAEFLRRFRAEARAAAALSHPNVMAVYDWSDGSEHGDAAFIVTEYLSGGSLRALLDAGAQLTPSQALGVGLEAARALDYAHRRGFVHRDIKPANLLFGEEQRLRIADFGLARALAEAAWTEPQGAVLGTARYASPEQAKGEVLSGKADVYSLALVLVEAVTGEVPFVADTTLGTLMARVDRPMVVADELGPLQSIITEAGASDPEQRIDARTLAKGLLRAARSLSRPAPLPLVGALASGTLSGADLDPTVHAASPLAASEAEVGNDLTADDLELDPPSWVNQAEAGAAAAAATGGFLSGLEVAGSDDPDLPDDADAADLGAVPGEADGAVADAGGPGPGPGDEPIPPDDGDDDEADDEAITAVPMGDHELDHDPGPEPGAADLDTDQVAAVPPVVPLATTTIDDDDDDADDGPRRRRRWPWVALIVILLLGIGGGAAAVVANQEDTPTAPPIVLPVPNLVGRSETQARAIAQAGGWKTKTVEKRQNDSEKGDVLDTDPAAGTRLPDGRTITLTVSIGQEMVAVPQDLAEKPLEDATAQLEAVGLVAREGEARYSEDLDKGVVIATAEGTPAELERGSTVTLVVSKGPEPRTIPGGLVGGSADAASEALEALGLQPVIVRSYSDTAKEGTVISVLPAAGEQVPRGASVNVEVSRGPQLIAVPSVVGASDSRDAAAILRAAGLKPGNVSGPADGSPKGTSPRAGTMVAPGTTVNIVLG
ncbi:MAG: protein kinase family protein with domain [Ilumatobacteraceae bacterium]|nr:protein kinase family protein with domain [Ilumatobacteraceae bacterium]